MNQKEKWIASILNDEKIIEKSMPSDALIQRLNRIPKKIGTHYSMVPKKIVWMSAASIALLICFNVISARQYDNNQNTETTSEIHFSHLKTM